MSNSGKIVQVIGPVIDVALNKKVLFTKHPGCFGDYKKTGKRLY